MYIWRGKNRRDRRYHATSNPFTCPTAIDVQGYKAWYHGRQLKDEKSRLAQERQFVDGYAARRVKAFQEFLGASMGKTQLRLVAGQLARIQAAEKRRQMRLKRQQLGLATTRMLGMTRKSTSVFSGETAFIGPDGMSESRSGATKQELESGEKGVGGEGWSLKRLFRGKQNLNRDESIEDDSLEKEEGSVWGTREEGKDKKGQAGMTLSDVLSRTGKTWAKTMATMTRTGMKDTFFKTEWAVGLDRQEAQKVFGLFDGDSTGSIDKNELRDLMEQLCIPLTDKELQDLMEELDTDKSGTIEFEEFFTWYENTAKQQRDKRMLKSAGLQVNKFLRAVRGLTLETEAKHIMLAHEEHLARDYAKRAFRTSRPPSFACPDCDEVCMTQNDLDLHLLDELVHEEWREKQSTTAERFKCVTRVMDGPMGRHLLCVRAQFDPLLYTPEIDATIQRLDARPMLADPDSRRLRQLVNGMCVETLSVYFSKRAAPANGYPHRHRKPFKPHDLPQSLSNLATRLLHEDRSVFTAHLFDVAGPAVSGSPKSSSSSKRSTARAEMRVTHALERLRQLKSTDPDFNTMLQPLDGSCVKVEFRWKTGTQAFLLGSFTEWREEIMQFDFDTREHSLVRPLSVGVHLYCFRVNGKLKVDTSKPVVGTGTSRRNVLTVWDQMEQQGPLPYSGTTVIDLSHQNIGDYGMWFLFSLLELTRPLVLSMDLSFNAISSHGMAGAAPILRHLSHLRCLKLNSNGIGYDGAKALGAALDQNIAVATLELANNPLGDDGVEAVSKGLQGNGNVTHLNLDNTMLGDDGLAALSDMLLRNAALRHLSIRYNRFTSRYFSSKLQPSLLCNSSLTSLDLSYNCLGPEAAHALAHALVASDSIRGLDLSCCQLCGKDGLAKPGIYYLAESLTKNKSLTKLTLCGNRINNFGATHLARALTHNRTLCSLDVGENPFLSEWLVPDHLLTTETYPDGLPSLNTSIKRNIQHQQDERRRWQEELKNEERRGREEEEERQRLGMLQAEQDNNSRSQRKSKRRLLHEKTQQLEEDLDRQHKQQEKQATIRLHLLDDVEEILCPQVKVQGEWQSDRSWLAQEVVDRQRRGDMQAAEDQRQAEEDKFVSAAVNEALDKVRSSLQKAGTGSRLLNFVMRGLRYIKEGRGGAPTTEDLLLNTDPPMVSKRTTRAAFQASRAASKQAKKKKAAAEKQEVANQDQEEGDDEDEEEEEEEEDDGMDDEQRQEIFRIFQAYDVDCSDSIDASEFEYMCKDLCLPLSHEEVQAVMKSLDTDASGEISYDEFYQWFKDMGRKTQGQRRMRTALLRMSNVLKNTTLVLQRSEAVRLILHYHERKVRLNAMTDFRKDKPPEFTCVKCNKAFAYDEPGRGLSKHIAEANAHLENERQEKALEPRLVVVERAMEAVNREMNLQWPKLFAMTKYVPKGQPWPVLDRPDDNAGRTIGGLEHDVTIKGLEYLHHGQWLKIEYRNHEQAYVRRRQGITYYVKPLVTGMRASALGRMMHKASLAAATQQSTAKRRRTCLTRVTNQFFGHRLRALAQSFSAWPIKVAQIDYFTSGDKYYSCGPGLPKNIQLKVRVQPDLEARVLGYLSSTMVIKAVGKSGDWIMVKFKTAEHSWMLVRNRQGRQLLVPETDNYVLMRVKKVNQSPYECKAEEKEEESDCEYAGDDHSDGDSIIDLLATTHLPDGGRV